jgi:geranylgeranyl reductase family protein
VTQRPDFDVVVAGGGAGGAACAYFLVQAGLSVLVLEKDRLPRYKACGGAIPRPTLERFPFAFDEVVRAAPTAARITFPGLPGLDVALPGEPVVMVMRSEFDGFLLEHSGAEVLDGTAVSDVGEAARVVQVRANGRPITARYLVGADGAISSVARALRLRQNPRLGGAIEAAVPLGGDVALQTRYGSRAVFSLGVIPWGYAWVFPKGDELSVGIGHFRPRRVDLRAELQREMARLGIGLDRVRMHGHALPSFQSPPWPFWRHRPQERLSTRRCVLVGDAAGLVDPLLGEGIRYAVSSARLAAGAILEDDLSGYEAAIWEEIGHSLATAALTADFYFRWPRMWYKLAIRNPSTIRLIVDVLAERASYQGIGRRLAGATARRVQMGRKE